jgi:anti-sigma-K factor RskA
MKCTEFEKLSGAYVLDAITPEEREEAETHLAQCAKCSRLLAELRPVVDLLALSVPQIEPSPELKELILSAIKERTTPAVQKIQPLFPSRQQRLQSRSHWNTQFLAAAAVLFFLLLGGLAGWNISLQQQLAATQQKIWALTPVVYTLRGTSANSNVTGQLIYYPQQDITVLVIRGLPQLEGTHVYQGWFLQGKQLTSIGVLNVKHGVATVDFPGNMNGFDAAAVSLEPGPSESGSAPKGSVVALGRLNKPAPTP